jgi:hypothetical protein
MFSCFPEGRVQEVDFFLSDRVPIMQPKASPVTAIDDLHQLSLFFEQKTRDKIRHLLLEPLAKFKKIAGRYKAMARYWES